eukprot:2026478-Pleurochrysis_carterae.AAC.2
MAKGGAAEESCSATKTQHPLTTTEARSSGACTSRSVEKDLGVPALAISVPVQVLSEHMAVESSPADDDDDAREKGVTLNVDVEGRAPTPARGPCRPYAQHAQRTVLAIAAAIAVAVAVAALVPPRVTMTRAPLARSAAAVAATPSK